MNRKLVVGLTPMSRKLVVGVVTAATTLCVLGMSALPSASASECTVVVTLVTGQKLYYHLPPGVSPSTLKLPPGVSSIKETCPKVPAPKTTPSPPPTRTTKPPPTKKKSSPPPSKPPPKSSGGGHSNPPPSHHGSGGSHPGSSHGSGGSHPSGSGSGSGSSHSSHGTTPQPPRTKTGVPTPSNPSFSFALPGAAALGVPNFFIESFAIPPFLLPIYQAAGIEYDVPWQVLAAINEVETDYGRNLSVSSAGAVGWMQFLPATWRRWGVDATGSGFADPYNPVDAIFAAARYLDAAGASKNLAGAIYAYNHAWWYVQSVLLRAKLIGGLPNSLVSALTGLVEGHFPVAAKARYADDYVEALARRRVRGAGAGVAVESDPSEKAVAIYARRGAPVIAVNDGRVVGLGHNARWGRYLQLQDANGNVYTYAGLGSVPRVYPVPRPVAVSAAGVLKALLTPAPGSGRPSAPATAGSQTGGGGAGGRRGSGVVSEASLGLPGVPLAAASGQSGQGLLPESLAEPAPQLKQRLFAFPSRAASFAAGGAIQLRSERAGQPIQSFENYFSGVLHLARDQYTLRPLERGSVVVAGTILGRVAQGTKKQASHLEFMIRPGGKDAPYIDPKPILDGWELLQATSIYRASGIDPFLGKDPSIGQLLLMSKLQLQQRVLSDPRVGIYPCGRRDIATGQIDRRILADIEFLSASGLKPYISGLKCGAGQTPGIDPAGKTGQSMDITKINNIPIAGHTGQGSITDLTIRRLLTLQGIFKPAQIISPISYKGQPTTLSLPDHKNRIQVTYTPNYGPNQTLSTALATILKPGQWIQLIQRLGQIPEPTVPINPSKYAIKR
jgi:hypothetical protein